MIEMFILGLGVGYVWGTLSLAFFMYVRGR